MISYFKRFFPNKKYSKITIAIKYIIFLNIAVSLFFFLFKIYTGKELQFYFGTYPTYSVHFHFYQLFTFLFVHSTSPIHLISNGILLLLFSPFMELKIGIKKFVLTYFIFAWVGFVFVNYHYYKTKEIIEKRILVTGICPEKIQLNEIHEVSLSYLRQLNHNQRNAVLQYNDVTSKTYGASGALYGIIAFYIVLNITNYRKTFFLFIGIYYVFKVIYSFFSLDIILLGSSYAHLGGMLTGLLFGLYIKMKGVGNWV